MAMVGYILLGISGFCCIGAIQERKDLMRMIAFFCVAAIFGLIGWVLVMKSAS